MREVVIAVDEDVPEVREPDVREDADASADTQSLCRPVAPRINVGECGANHTVWVGLREVHVRAQILLVRPALEKAELGVVERAIEPVVMRAEAGVLAVVEQVRRTAEAVSNDAVNRRARADPVRVPRQPVLIAPDRCVAAQRHAVEILLARDAGRDEPDAREGQKGVPELHHEAGLRGHGGPPLRPGGPDRRLIPRLAPASGPVP